MRLRMYSMVLMMSVLFPQCTETPEIIFPVTGERAVISARVYPSDGSVMVYLVGADNIDSTSLNRNTEMFEFRDVPYGSYFLRIKAEGYGTTELRVIVREPVVTFSQITLSRFPLQVVAVEPPQGTVIDSAFMIDKGNAVNDSAIEVRVVFHEVMDTASVQQGITVQPSMKIGYRWQSNLKSIYLALPREELDGDSDLVITIDTGAVDVYGHHLERDLTVIYPVMPGLGNVASPQRLVAANQPQTNGKNVLPSEPVMIWFDSIMHEASVEEAFSIAPASAPPHFVWDMPSGKHRITVTFPGGLRYGTRYTVALAAGWRTVDSSMAGSTWSYSFTTEKPVIRDFSPRNGERSVPIAAPVTLTTNFRADAAVFLEAFSVSPAVDSLRCFIDATRNSIRIEHEPFDSGTVYTVTIDSTLYAQDSSTLERALSFSFTTIAAPEEIDETDTVAWVAYPAEGTGEWPVGKMLTITFAEEMASSLIDSVLTITPSLSYYTVWSEPAAGGHRLELRPRSLLRSATVYVVEIPSGYRAASGKKTGRVRFSFTTQPLRVIGHTPAHGQINVVSNSIGLVFNMPVAVASLGNAVHMEPETNISAYVADTTDHAAGEWSYHVHMKELDPDTRYTVTVDTTVTDLFGIAMPESLLFSFTTGE
ncbi:MAG: Ig-like domain-containing protein [Chitinispirillaceae bacterium]|nr:Ig-like domain-containing protein [Chitinispirillaceae bacterium]